MAGRNAFRYFKYILPTGAGWYQDIGEADILLNVKEINFTEIEEISPDGYTVDKEKTDKLAF